MSLMLNAIFTENGSPKDGLTNTVIYIYDLSDNSLIVNGVAVTAVAKGGYKYNFTTYDGDKDYYIVWDSVDLTGHERYAYVSLRHSTDDDWADGGRLDLLLDAIPTTVMRGTDNAATEAKQDIIAGYLDTEIAAIITHLTQIKGAGWVDENLTTIDAIVDAITAKTTNLPADPADQSLIIAATDAIVTEINANEVKIDRLLGLTNENTYIDTTVFDSNGNLSSARLRIYSVAGSVGTDSDVLAIYTITAVGVGKGKFSSWKQVKQ